MMLKDYSHLPLKKRPVIHTENTDNSLKDREEIKEQLNISSEPIDLTTTRSKTRKLLFANERNCSLKLSNENSRLTLSPTIYKQKLPITKLTSANFNYLNSTVSTKILDENQQNNSRRCLKPSSALDGEEQEKYRLTHTSRDSLAEMTLNCQYNNSFLSITTPSEKTTPEALPRTYKKPYNNPCKIFCLTNSILKRYYQYHCPPVDGNHVGKSFNCTFCKEIYTSLAARKMYIGTHPPACKCHMCGKAFSQLWLLQSHTKTHTGEKTFSCQQCSKAFAESSNLRAHLQTHHDVKIYSCPTCRKTFSRMSLLTKHNEGGCPGNGPQIQSYPTPTNCNVPIT